MNTWSIISCRCLLDIFLLCFQELAAEISDLQRKKEDLEAELKKVSAIIFFLGWGLSDSNMDTDIK